MRSASDAGSPRPQRRRQSQSRRVQRKDKAVATSVATTGSGSASMTVWSCDQSVFSETTCGEKIGFGRIVRLARQRRHDQDCKAGRAKNRRKATHNDE